MCSAVAWVSWKPCGPVQALAPPALSTTARTMPARRTCWLHSTGAALTRLRGEDAGRGRVRPVVDDQGDVRPAAVRRPAATPLARNPFGAVTVMAATPGGRR